MLFDENILILYRNSRKTAIFANYKESVNDNKSR